jgi:hypothetical protein
MLLNLLSHVIKQIVMPFLNSSRSNKHRFVFLAEQIHLPVHDEDQSKPTNRTNLLEKKLLPSNDGNRQDGPHLSSSSTGSFESSIPLILMNKQIELIHPLEHQWSFWYLKNQQGKDWQENLMKLATFGYVEEFWA